MSVRSRSHGRGRGRARGSTGSARTQIWEWETYKPGPEVYDSLWHIRRAPPSITPNLPNDCPVGQRIPGAQSRILDRKQNNDAIRRYYYEVLVRTPITPESSDGAIAHAGIKQEEGMRDELIEVDVSRILEFVSPRELERYENEDMRRAAEAEAVTRQAEAEERAQRQLGKNAWPPGAGRGKLLLSELDVDSVGMTMNKGRPSGGKGHGRGRGKVRGGGKGRGRGRGGCGSRDRGGDRGRLRITLDGCVDEEEGIGTPSERMSKDEDPMEGGMVSVTPVTRSLERSAMGTEYEPDFEEEVVHELSPIMRSAFVANSALPMSPLAVHRRQPKGQGMGDSDEEISERMSLSSAASQLMFEMHQNEQPIPGPSEEERTRVKRRRTNSASSSCSANESHLLSST